MVVPEAVCMPVRIKRRTETRSSRYHFRPSFVHSRCGRSYTFANDGNHTEPYPKSDDWW